MNTMFEIYENGITLKYKGSLSGSVYFFMLKTVYFWCLWRNKLTNYIISVSTYNGLGYSQNNEYLKC